MALAAQLTASEAEFELEAGPFAATDLTVLDFEQDEELSQPFSLDVTVVAGRDVEVKPAQLVGEKALFTIHVGPGAFRYVDGIVAEVKSWEEGKGDDRKRHRLRVVPALWKLGHVRRSRIFQSLAVPDIVKKVLDEGKVKHRESLSGSYKPRIYCVQYDESDLDFVSRLLEEEGIFWFFEHEKKKHTMVLADAPSACAPIPGEERIVFREPSRMSHGAEHIDDFSARVEVCPGKVSLRDYNELKPAVDLTTSSQVSKDTELEVYEFPGGYSESGPGKTLAKVRLEEERVRADTASGSGFSRRLLPGHTFELDEHPIQALNAKYLLVSVHHRGDQREALGHGAPAGGLKREGYRNHFSCIPKGTPFRTARRTPRPVIPGPQTAIVVGPSGEEIHCDEHGRIKVQFHWDREGKKDEKSSCWIRVSQAWAGPGWGALYLPRIGQEVVVEFLEGDPDRPLVTGAVYNGMNPPPIALPGDKTRSTLRSASSPGSGGSNELRFEDRKDAEEIYLHAQKDFDIVIEHDKTQQIGHDETLEVGGDRSREISGNQTLHVGKDDTTRVDGNQSLHVKKDRSTKVSGSHTETVTGSQSISVGQALAVTVGGICTEQIGGAKSVTVGAAYGVTVGAAMSEVVGGVKSEDVGGSRSESVGGNKTENIGGARSVSVAADLSETVGGARTVKIGKDLALEVGGKLTQMVADACSIKAKEISFTADDSFLAKIGSATLELKKSGDVVIKGAKIELKASGDLVLKASKISEN